jgi:hypothetical protein
MSDKGLEPTGDTNQGLKHSVSSTTMPPKGKPKGEGVTFVGDVGKQDTGPSGAPQHPSAGDASKGPVKFAGDV